MAAEAMLNGPYDFNRTPIAPLGTKCIVHDKPAVRGTWVPHSINGWYIGPARDHYRCYSMYIPSIKGVRTGETVEFFLCNVTMPAIDTSDLIKETVKDMAHIIHSPSPAAPFKKFGTDTSIALAKLADIFEHLQQKTLPKIRAPPTPNPPPKKARKHWIPHPFFCHLLYLRG